MGRIVDLAALDSVEVTRRQDGYVAAVDAISSTDTYATYESSLTDSERTWALALAIATQTKLGADATAANLSEANLADAAVDALLSQASAQQQWTLDLFDAGGDQLLAQAQATREAALTGRFAPSLLPTPERFRRKVQSIGARPGAYPFGPSPYWVFGGSHSVHATPGRWSSDVTAYYGNGGGAPLPVYKASGVIGSYGELGKVYTVNPSVNDGVKEFKAYVVRPTLTRFHRLSNLSAIVTNHPGPTQFVGAGPVQQFDPSTIVDTAMTRVVEQLHAEPAPDEQRVFNVQTDPLFQIAEAHHLLPEAVQQDESVGNHAIEVLVDLLVNPDNAAAWRSGLKQGFWDDGVIPSKDLVTKDAPSLLADTYWKAGWVVYALIDQTGWFFTDNLREQAAKVASVARKAKAIQDDVLAAFRRASHLTLRDLQGLLAGDTDRLFGKAPDELILAIEASGDAVLELLKEVEAKDIARLHGRITGLLAYELAEGAALTLFTGGAGAAAKAIKLEKIANKFKTILGAKHGTAIANAIETISTRLARWAGARMCFVAGTRIHTLRGLKNIENIRPGDLVLSRPQAGARIAATEFKPVVQTFVTHPDTLYHLTIHASDGREERISTTAPHPFFVLDPGEFVPADELRVGDRLSLPEGAATVERIEIEHAEPGTSFTTYNFEVEDCHTYFAGELGAWVHNAGDRLCMLLAAKFEKRVDNGQSAEQAFRQIEALAERYGNITKKDPGVIRMHLWDGLDAIKAKGKLPANFEIDPKWTRHLRGFRRVTYGTTDLSVAATQYRIAHKIRGKRNVAVFEYRSADGSMRKLTKASQRNVGHAERLAVRDLKAQGIDPRRVTRIYSELQPCHGRGGYCARLIRNEFPDAEVTFSFEYGLTRSSQEAGLESLQRAVDALFN